MAAISVDRNQTPFGFLVVKPPPKKNDYKPLQIAIACIGMAASTYALYQGKTLMGVLGGLGSVAYLQKDAYSNALEEENRKAFSRGMGFAHVNCGLPGQSCC